MAAAAQSCACSAALLFFKIKENICAVLKGCHSDLTSVTLMCEDSGALVSLLSLHNGRANTSVVHQMKNKSGCGEERHIHRVAIKAQEG